MNEFEPKPNEFVEENALLDQKRQQRLNELRIAGMQCDLTPNEQAELQNLQKSADEALRVRKKEIESF